ANVVGPHHAAGSDVDFAVRGSGRRGVTGGGRCIAERQVAIHDEYAVGADGQSRDAVVVVGLVARGLIADERVIGVNSSAGVGQAGLDLAAAARTYAAIHR